MTGFVFLSPQNRIDELLNIYKKGCEIPPTLAGKHSYREKDGD
jgi:hypothetical protein